MRASRSDSKRIIENGIITQMRADWILPKEKKLEVTLKILNSESNLPVSFVDRFKSRFRMHQWKFFIRIAGIYAFGSQMEQFGFTGAHQDVWLHVVFPAHTSYRIDEVRTAGRISAEATEAHSFDCESNRYGVFAGQSTALFAREWHHPRPYPLLVATSHPFRATQFADGTSR